MDFSRFLHRPFLDLPIPHIASRDAPSGPDGVPGGTSVTYRIPRLVHRTTVSLGELLLEFDSIETARGFSIRWSIHAAHQPEGATGELHFQVSPDRDLGGALRLLGVDVDDEDAE